MPTTALYNIYAVAGSGYHITHVPSNTHIAIAPTALIASKLVAVLMVAEVDAPVEWTRAAGGDVLRTKSV